MKRVENQNDATFAFEDFVRVTPKETEKCHRFKGM